jgi:hypothetical protein
MTAVSAFSNNVSIKCSPRSSFSSPAVLFANGGGTTHLRLVGTGVRTVSFLNIRVYTAAFYVSEPELNGGCFGEQRGHDCVRIISGLVFGGSNSRRARVRSRSLTDSSLRTGLLTSASSAPASAPSRSSTSASTLPGRALRQRRRDESLRCVRFPARQLAGEGCVELGFRFYVSEPELDAALAGKLAGWEAYAPERLIPPPLAKRVRFRRHGRKKRG